MGSTRWKVLPQDMAAEQKLVAALGIDPLVARVLVARGMTDAAAACAFLHPDLERDWSDPLAIPGMAAAADRVEQAVRTHETIAIFGDFDVDGMSAASLLTLALHELSADVHPFIPDRFQEGYGLSTAALERVIASCAPSVVITVDNGIAAGNETAWLRKKGIDAVVTDHHEPGELVPQGVPVADPKLSEDCPSRELSGAGVALKLVCELGQRFGKPQLWRELTDLAALGTVSDMMRLTGENRSLVADGIERIRRSTRPGIVALAAASGTDLAEITSDELPFSLVPRLNAAGRMGQTDVAFRLLLTQDIGQATALASRLEKINAQRRTIESKLTDEAVAAAQASWDPSKRVVVVAGEGWHEGVKGIVASRLVARYHVPAIVFSLVDGQARGSGRSVGSVDLFHAVEQCEDLTVRFGGHAGAVGVTVGQDELGAFTQRLEQVMGKLPEEQFATSDEVDTLVRLSEVNVGTIGALEALQPFGPGNERPLLGVRGVSMRRRSRVGAMSNHLRFVATDGIALVPAIMFRAPDIERACDTEGVVDLVFEANNETWQGRTKAKLMVKDILYRDQPATAQPASNQPAAGQPITAQPTSSVASGGGVTVPAGAAIAASGERAGSGRQRRARLAALPDSELTDELVAGLIGDNALLPAQHAALGRLAAGHSVLCVMATGRGKSLIFHVHAAREAIKRGKASVFVYPLRALVADQKHHLSDYFARLGVDVRVLTGESSAAERSAVWDGLVRGGCDVILTTPEFLALHIDRFTAAHRVGFLVVDEAHHVREAVARRPAYAKLPAILEALGRPTALAVTATASTVCARQVQGLLGIADDDVIVDDTVRDNLRLHDCRGLSEREELLASIVARNEKCVVYVNSRDETVSATRRLRHVVGELADRIAYYNAGLSRTDRGRVEGAFRTGRLSCIVSTSAFGEGVDVPDIRHVVLYHLPFGRTEFNQMSGRAGRDGSPADIWPLFGAEDVLLNERLLASDVPSRGELVTLYRALRLLSDARLDTQVAHVGGVGSPLVASDEEIATAARHLDRSCALGARGVAAGIAVFAELGFLTVELKEGQRLISMDASPRHMQLESSARYAEGRRATEEFSHFKDWALGCEPQELLKSVNRPIVPGFGQVVDGGEVRIA